MSIYNKNEWVDHVEDIDTGAILQEGTLYCARLMNHIEEGIYLAHTELEEACIKIDGLETKVTTLEQNIINGMTANNFIEDLSSLNDVLITDGIYNQSTTKLYL